MKRFLKLKLILAFVALAILATTILGTWSGNLMRTHAQGPTSTPFSTTFQTAAPAHQDIPTIPRLKTVGATENSTASTGPYCYYGACFYYAGAAQSIIATGAAVTISQAAPTVGPSDYHSLAELAVESADGQQIVEAGWIVAPSQIGDAYPHLFVYHWVNGAETCYNGCGYVPIAGTTVNAGSRLPTGRTGRFRVSFANNQWQIRYNGTEIGYFPESLWQGTYKQAGLIQVFGEVAAASTGQPHSQMGNGILGSKTGSAKLSSFALFGTSASPKLATYAYGDPSAYNYGGATATGLRFGGPGY